jgi:hypothetical protein
MTARFLTQLALECRRIAEHSEMPRVITAMTRRARAYLDAAREAESESARRRIVAPAPALAMVRRNRRAP